MKCLLTMGMSLLSLLCYSQVYRLKAFEGHIAIFNEGGKEISNPDLWGETDAIVVIDLDKRKVKVYGNKDIDIDLVNKDSATDDNDKIVIYYKGIDEYGQTCLTTIAVFKDGNPNHIATLLLNYISMRTLFVYKLKRDD